MKVAESLWRLEANELHILEIFLRTPIKFNILNEMIFRKAFSSLFQLHKFSRSSSKRRKKIKKKLKTKILWNVFHLN